MSKRLEKFVGTCLSAAFLAACGGSNGLSPPAPFSAGHSVLRGHGPHGVKKAAGWMESLLYSFEGGSDGFRPYAGLVNVNGTFYGTTYIGGGSDRGTVFAIAPSGTKTVLHSFSGGSDGANPSGDLVVVNGTLYGTTRYGGGGACFYAFEGCGTVFSITTSGSENVLYKFGSSGDGYDPQAGLTNVNGMLYGTTFYGGIYGSSCYGGCGTVFTITTSGTESVLYSFKGGKSDGWRPDAPLTSDSTGTTLFGTTNAGGASTYGGTAFSITTSGTETVLHSFGGSGDGAYPTAGLTSVSGTYYGVTSGGGASNDGTVFSITASGTEAVLHSFSNSDGGGPNAGMTNVGGTLYGTTAGGGEDGDGTVFSITTAGVETVLHSFAGYPSDGRYPAGDLISVNGTLYGTTVYGGTAYTNGGTVFSLTPPPESVLYSFSGSPDGQNPYAGIVLAPNGTLFGTTPAGGAYNLGTIYSIKQGTESVRQSFYTGSDGATPYGGLIDGTKKLYGTTAVGGVYNAGTAFSMTPSGIETVLHSFGGGSADGTTPLASLLNGTSTVYGTTQSGGANNAGTIFAISKSTGRETLLHSFGGGSGDGAGPEYAKLVTLSGTNGTMYGTTRAGGAHNEGTVYSIKPSGAETVIHSFGSGSGEGTNPYAGVIAVNGTLYGTTLNGGAYGQGTVYSITTGSSSVETVLHSFGGGSGEGASPYGGLLDVNGTLYGTTSSGGANGQGTVYSITTYGTYAVLWSFGGQSDGATPRSSLIKINDYLYGTTTQGGTHGDGTVFKLLL
jgi:uncharacterized repeat protein (TIGR03803 family)